MRRIAYGAMLLAGIAGLAAVALVYTPRGQDLLLQQATSAMMARPDDPIDGMRVVICGSASPLGNSADRAQACVAVLTDTHFFLFDVGAGAPLRINQARLPTARLTAVLLTHFHSDHISGLPDINLGSWVQGRSGSLPVLGPSGVQTVVAGFNQAYSLDAGYRAAHHGADLLPPAAHPMTAQPFTPGDIVWRDESLTIRSIGVEHAPIEPAVTYRVDYAGRSVVISGDTIVSDALFEASNGADVLLHDALSRPLLDPLIATAANAGNRRLSRIMTDVIDYHADSQLLEARAKAAGVQQLVLYHLVPAPPNAIAERIFARGVSADTIIARDLHRFDLPPDSTEIRIHAP